MESLKNNGKWLGKSVCSLFVATTTCSRWFCKNVLFVQKWYRNVLYLAVFLQAFNKCKREGFRLQTVDKAPLAKRRKMKKTSTSTETRSSSGESTHSSSSSSQSQEKAFQDGDPNPQPSNSTPLTTPVNTPVVVHTDSGNMPAPPAFHFTEEQWKAKGKGRFVKFFWEGLETSSLP